MILRHKNRKWNDMKIRSKFKDYRVIFEKNFNFIESLLEEEYSKIVLDKQVYEIYEDLFSTISAERLFLIDAKEENKTIETALKICEIMTEIPTKRNVHLISFGGGIVQDITGFVANVLYRGVRWTFIPTTLLAACDSCIGGKTSLNYKSFKNLLGTFYPPDIIHICPLFFKTLTQQDFESGMGEVIKFNIMAGKDGLEHIEKHIDKLLSDDVVEVTKCVEKSLNFKKKFIEIDEFDCGERIKLNFAHTFGHAIETATNYIIPHGTAVAIGMIMANSVSVKRGILDKEFEDRSRSVLLKVIHIDKTFLEVPMDKFIGAIRKDKKQIGNNLTAVLMEGYGDKLEILHDISEEEVGYALNDFKERYFHKE